MSHQVRGAQSSSGRGHYQDALEWVEDKSTDWLFSFNNICDLLGFDPDYLRQILLKKEGKYANPAHAKIYSFPIVTGQV